MDMTKSQNGPENGLVNRLAQFHYKDLLYHLFCRYKSDNNMTITYINRLQQQSGRLKE